MKRRRGDLAAGHGVAEVVDEDDGNVDIPPRSVDEVVSPYPGSIAVPCEDDGV